MVDAYLYVARGLLFAVAVIAWTIAYAEDYEYKDYFLAVALCLGKASITQVWGYGELLLRPGQVTIKIPDETKPAFGPQISKQFTLV